MIGDRLRTKMILLGHPACPNTAKALQTAGEKGVDVESRIVGPNDNEFKSVSPFGIEPVIQDIDFVVVGAGAVLSYLDDKGFGPSLVPRHGMVRAVMYQWIILSQECAEPNVVEHTGDEYQIKINKAGLEPLFDALENQLQNPTKKGDFICGEFTLADIHWAAYCNLIEAGGEGGIISSRSTVNSWLDKVKSHPSTSKEKLEPYTCLPTAEDIKSGALRNISINA